MYIHITLASMVSSGFVDIQADIVIGRARLWIMDDCHIFEKFTVLSPAIWNKILQTVSSSAGFLSSPILRVERRGAGLGGCNEAGPKLGWRGSGVQQSPAESNVRDLQFTVTPWYLKHLEKFWKLFNELFRFTPGPVHRCHKVRYSYIFVH